MGNNELFLNSYFPLKAILSILPAKVLHFKSFSGYVTIWLIMYIFMLMSLHYDSFKR